MQQPACCPHASCRLEKDKLRIARLSICSLNSRYFKLLCSNSSLWFWGVERSLSSEESCSGCDGDAQIHSERGLPLRADTVTLTKRGADTRVTVPTAQTGFTIREQLLTQVGLMRRTLSLLFLSSTVREVTLLF